MTKAEVEKLKDLFTMKNEDIGDICNNLEVDPLDVMKAIITFTKDPEDFKKVDEFSKLMYVTGEAYTHGFMAALYYVNEINKDAIQAMEENGEILIA